MNYTYVNEDKIDIELKCSICNKPFQSPMTCRSCGNTYCRDCIMKWLTEQYFCPLCHKNGNQFLPVISRVVINQLNRLIVQCKLCQQNNIQRNNFNDHIFYTCPKKRIQCIDHCGWHGYRCDLEQHLIECRKQKFLSLQSIIIIIIVIILAIIFYLIL